MSQSVSGPAAGQPSSPDGAPAPSRRRGERVVLLSIAALALAGGGWAAKDALMDGAVTTDNAYVRGDIMPLVTRLDGYVTRVAVGDYAEVRAGDVLFEIDRRDYEAKRDQVRADRDGSRAALDVLAAQQRQQAAAIDAAAATVEADRASLRRAEVDRDREVELARRSFGSRQKADQAVADALVAQANLQRDLAALEAARAVAQQLAAQRERQQADLAGREAALALAELDLSRTVIRAPADGVVNERLVRQGQYVRAGTQLATHVAAAPRWVVANFKETQLHDIRPGDAATVRVDLLGGARFRGRVEALAPGTGASFALIPPDNATGNFTKVVQRMGVRIVLDEEPGALAALRPGLSVVVSVAPRRREAPDEMAAR